MNHPDEPTPFVDIAGRVAGVFRYPVKSCGGIADAAARVLPAGLAFDREWMIVDAATGACLTQRELPRMARIAVRLDEREEGVLRLSYSENHAAGAEPADRADATGIALRLRRDDPAARREATIWGFRCEAIDEGDEVARALDAWLERPGGKTSRLVRIAPDHARQSGFGGAPISFPDASPVHLLSQATLDDLNARLAAAGAESGGADASPTTTAMTMERFRPNLVVAGCEAGAEDRWRRVRIGGTKARAAGRDALELVAQGPCPRCVVVTIDPVTGERGKEPLATLAGYRKQGFATMFGRYFAVASPGVVEVGAEIEVLETE